MVEEDQDSRIETGAALLSLLYALVSVVWVMWIMIPAHRKRLIAMQLTWRLHQSARLAAFRSGHRAMGRELSGRAVSYELPYRLSLAAEESGRIYDKLRYTA